MDIKEIVLKVADSLRNKVDGVSHMQSNQGLVAFAEALIAEIAKHNEPVAINEPNYHYEAMGCGLEDRGITDRYEAMEYGWNCAIERMFEQLPKDPLFTFPPTAEQIANETAWQPIETAPKGERFLTATKLSNGSYGQVGISHKFYCYAVNARGWAIAGDDPHATHWMPLPTPPKRGMEGV